LEKGGKEYLKVFISDTGEGIPLENQEKIFIKFSRGSSTSSINPNGSGLGLYIAKTIIENSRGELRLENSEVGKGTTFSFILEIAKTAQVGKDIAVKINNDIKNSELVKMQ
jgi:signal transduction histidine kinase